MRRVITTLIILFCIQITYADSFDKHKPEDVDEVRWSSLKAAVQQAKLLPEPAVIDRQFTRFGYSVSVDGDRALIGAPVMVNRGVVYVLEFAAGSWVETQILQADDSEEADNFGIAVSLNGDRALIGAWGDDDNGNESGSAYVFDFSGGEWSQTAKITSSDGAASDHFGSSVSLSGDRALIGAYGDDDNGGESGSAYIFDFSGGVWGQTTKLTASDGVVDDQFGISVSLSGDRVLIGAWGDDDNGGQSGSAYIFDFTGGVWGQTAKLTATDGAFGHFFGNKVSLSGDRALIGAIGDDDNGGSSGSAYIFDFSGGVWGQTAKLTASDGTTNDLFGVSVSLSGDRALIGAHFDDDNGGMSGSAYIFDFSGGVWSQTTKLTASDGASSDQFGFSVSLSGDRVLIGSPYDDDNASDSGSAYIFDYSGGLWSQTTKLTAVDGAAGDSFGFSVSLSGDRALIGAYGDDDNAAESGSVYIFDFAGGVWAQSVKLSAADRAAGDRFGYAVSLSGDRALIGAYLDDDNGSGSGSAYIFDFAGGVWAQTAKLTAAGGAPGDNFGYAVSLFGDRALIGAYRDDDNGSGSGSAYVYDLSGGVWSQSAKLTATDGAGFDNFGSSVSLSGDRALVGAYLNDGNASNSGSAYVFDFAGGVWTQTTKLTASDGAAGDRFGSSVSLSGDRVLIGAYRDDEDGFTDSGSAYIFDFAGGVWSQTTKLTATDGAASDNFGYSLSLSGDRALIGAYLDDDHGNDSGSVYLFDFEGGVWSQTSKITAADGAMDDNFGTSVSFSGNRAVIGAHLDDDHGSNSGSAYVFNVPLQYDVNISVSGLAATNTVSFSNGGDLLDISADGTQTISTLDDGSAFDVDITTQPDTPNQVCSFDNSDSGTLNGDDYTVNVTCVTTQYDVNISVSGLAATNTVSFSNGGDLLDISADGTQTISTLDDGSAFDVDITAQPNSPDQVCSFVNADSGTLTGDNYTVNVTCVTTQYDVNISVSGLAATNTVSFNNGIDTLDFTTDGTQTISTLDDGTAYDVDITSAQPVSPNQTCGFTNADSGTLAGSDVTVTVECITEQYVIGGSLSGLASGNSVALQNNGGDNLIVSSDGAFVFSTPIDDLTTYSVSVLTHPTTPNQTCEVDFGSGTVNGDDIDTVVVTCSVNNYFIGGTTTGLFRGNSILLRNDNSFKLVTVNGAYIFKTPLPDATGYAVSIFQQPQSPLQPCTLQNPTGIIAGDDVIDIDVSCEFGDDLIYRHSFEDEPANL